jgi:hypothetical protein
MFAIYESSKFSPVFLPSLVPLFATHGESKSTNLNGIP